MKRLLITAALVLVTGLAFAQNGPGSGTSSNSYTINNDYDHLWSTNCLQLTNVPVAWSNKVSHSYSSQSAAGGGGQVQSQFGKKTLPADVQSIVQQFQQDRTRLMSQLKDSSDEQRRQILQQMDQIRLQTREQISKIRDDARQQAEQMRSRFGNNRDAILDQGAGAGAGTGGNAAGGAGGGGSGARDR